MPCDSSYLEPTQREAQIERAHRLLVWLNKRAALGHEISPIGGYENDPWPVVALCAMLKNLPAKRRDAIVYDGRDKTARDLADWWDEHEEADRKREKKFHETPFDDDGRDDEQRHLIDHGIY